MIACDCFDVAKAKARGSFIDSILKGNPSIDRDKAERDLLSLAAERASQQPDEQPETDAQELLSKMPQHMRNEARAMLESPDLMQRVLEDVAACGVAGERELAASIYLVAVSRLLPKPLSAIVQAPSSTGKSFAVETLAELFPPEAVIHATMISPKALVYMKPGTLCHRFVVAGERSRRQDDETADATKMLREMQSSGRISQLVAIKDGGQIVTKRIEQDGPIAYIETTTLSNVFNEDANRSLSLATDERAEQTARIIKNQAARYSGAEAVNAEPIIQRHHAIQRMLQQRPVVIPLAREIADRFKVERVEARRAFPHLMGMVAASALLHQFQRKIDDEGRIVAEQFDYELAECLCRGLLARLLEGQSSDAAQRFLEWLRGWQHRKYFTVAEVAKQYHVSKTAASGWLNELKDAGVVEVAEPHHGSQPAKWALVATQAEIDTAGFAPSCDNAPPSKPDLAQIICKYRDKIVVPSVNAGDEGDTECGDDEIWFGTTDQDDDFDECFEQDDNSLSDPYNDEPAERPF